MRRVFAVFAFFVGGCAAIAPRPVAADTFEAARPELLQACVASAGAERDALERCIGAVAHPCIESDGGSTISEVLCWDAEATAWRDVINTAAMRLAESQPYRSAALLAEANESWTDWADAECAFWSWEEGGGSGEQVDRARCAAHISAARAISLLVGEAP